MISHTNKKRLDNKNGFGVASSVSCSKQRTTGGTRSRKHSGIFVPTVLPGVDEIKYPLWGNSQPSSGGFEHPASSKMPKSKTTGGITMKNPVVGINSKLCPESLLWTCHARLKFLTTLANESDFIQQDDVFPGFLLGLNDVRDLLALAIEKFDGGVA